MIKKLNVPKAFQINQNNNKRQRIYFRKNRKPCVTCGTTNINKKMPQEYIDGQAIWDEECFGCCKSDIR